MNTSVNGSYARASYAFVALINTQLIAFLRNVITLMTGNAQYPTPSPTLEVMKAAVDAFETAVHEALDGGKIAIATRDAQRVEVLSLARQLASYVDGHCNNDLVTLLSSGFTGVKAKSHSYVPAAPGNQRLQYTGKSGELMLRFDRISNAMNYSIECATSPEGPWEARGLSTTTRVTLDNLTPGKVYWARASANGAAGSSDFGGPATAMAV